MQAFARDDLVGWKPGFSICQGCYHGPRGGSVKQTRRGMSGLGRLVDGPSEPTPTAPMLKIETARRCKHAVVSIGSNIWQLAPKTVKDGKSSQEAVCPCVSVRVCVPCVSPRRIFQMTASCGLARFSRETRERQQHQEAGGARVPNQGLPPAHRILLIFRPDECHN